MPSLKQFHITFVIISVMLCLFLGYWSYNQSLMIYFSLSIISILMLIIYGTKFYSKVKDF